MAGRRNPHECRPLGPLALAGLPERGRHGRGAVGSACTTSATTRRSRCRRVSTFVRPSAWWAATTEIGVIDDGVQLVSPRDRDREILLVSGEAGLGKTTLVAEAARIAFNGGRACCSATARRTSPRRTSCSPSRSATTSRTHPRSTWSSTSTHTAPSSLASCPCWPAGCPSSHPSKATDADTERYLLFAAVVGLLAEVSATRAVVLVLDDLQWADAGSLALLRHVAAGEQPMRVLVLGTYRDSELAQADKLRDTLGVLHRHRGVSRIDLTGLDDAGVLAFMEAAAGHDLDDDGVALAHDVYRETDGNPFFVSEVLRHFAETGAIFQDDSGRWVAADVTGPMPLPDSVREVVGGRVARLGPDAGAGAVDRRGHRPRLRARRADRRDERDRGRAARRARRRGGGRVGARGRRHAGAVHVRARAHPAHDLRGSRRSPGAPAHAPAVAEALEGARRRDVGARAGELARHWMIATQPIDVREGDRVLAPGRPTPRSRRSRPPKRSDTSSRRSSCCRRSRRSRADPAPRPRDRARHRPAPDRRPGVPRDAARRRAQARRARRHRTPGRRRARQRPRVLQRRRHDRRGEGRGARDARSLALPADDPDRALVLATLCSELAHGSTLERRQALADEAVAIAERVGDDATVVRVLNHVYIPLQVPHLLDGRSRAHTHAARRRANSVGDPALVFWAAMWRGETAAPRATSTSFDRCIAAARRDGRAARPADLRLGAHVLARDCARSSPATPTGPRSSPGEALQIGTESGQPDAALIFGAQLMIVSGQRGNDARADPAHRGMAADAPDISPWLFGSLLAKAHVEAGRFDDATRKLEEFAAAGYDMALDQVWLTGMVDYAEAAIECARPGVRAGAARAARALGRPVARDRGIDARRRSACISAGSPRCSGATTTPRSISRSRPRSAHADRREVLRGPHRSPAGPAAARGGAAADEERARKLLTRAREAAITHKYANVQRLAEAALA